MESEELIDPSAKISESERTKRCLFVLGFKQVSKYRFIRKDFSIILNLNDQEV